jgi:hypothetical protein
VGSPPLKATWETSRVDTKFRDTKFREISHQEFISYFAKFLVYFAKFREISQPSFEKFREIKMEIVSEISRNKKSAKFRELSYREDPICLRYHNYN